jgi:TolB protein
MRATVFCSLVAVAATLVVGAARGATPKNGLIYFENFDDDTLTEAIYAVNPDGSGLKTVAASATANLAEPAVSPNNKQIAYLNDEGGDAYRLHLMNLDGSGDHALPTGGSGADAPSWSPNGASIVFSRCVALDEDTGDCTSAQIAEIGANGQNLRFLTKAVADTVDSRPSFRPDGKAIVFQRTGADGNVSVWVMAANGAASKQIVGSGSDVDANPSYSPNGKKLLYTSDAGGSDGIWIVNATGSGKVKLLSESSDPDDPTMGGGTDEPALSPDGKRIVYTAGGDLWTAAIDGATPKQLTTGGGDEADWARG